MSKRARITLDSDMEAGTDQETDPESLSETELDTDDEYVVAVDDPSATSFPARMALNTGTVVKAVVAGLVVVSLVLLWKNRRP